MRLTPKKIDFSQGFTQENDLFGRENFAKQLENIIVNSEDESLVFGIDDNWGSGKTTFLRLWEGRLNNSSNPKLKMVYFDAFEYDYQQDAFLAIASKIYNLIDKKSNTLKKKFIDSAKVVGKNLFSMATKVGINVATSGLVSGSIIESSADTISDSLTDPLDKFIEDKIKGAKRDEESIIHFKDTLEMISVDKRIIFVIDELDRARPDFSLEILEKIKHVFSAKNFIFILSMNRDQFEKTIIKKYGEIDASLYLSKFITHWFTLPKDPETQIKRSSLSKYCEHLTEATFNNDSKYGDLLPVD
ncbi:UNVERIFIED_ORG: putative KAP-like P-loop ATPase [Rahnella aquatilis]